MILPRQRLHPTASHIGFRERCPMQSCHDAPAGRPAVLKRADGMLRSSCVRGRVGRAADRIAPATAINGSGPAESLSP